MMRCDSCGERLPNGTRFCLFCGAEQKPAAAVKIEPASDDKLRSIEAQTDTDPQDAETLEIDDDWRPFRYERPVRKARTQSRSTRAKRRSTRSGSPTLRVLVVWLLAAIVMAAGVFWYVWTGNAAPAQPSLTVTSTYRSEVSAVNLAELTPVFSRFSRQ